MFAHIKRFQVLLFTINISSYQIFQSNPNNFHILVLFQIKIIIRINYVKAKKHKTQQNCKWRLCDNRDETINHIISESSKLAQKEYNIRYDWLWYVIHWEFCHKFDHTNKCTTQNSSSRMRRINSVGYEITTDHLISARRPDFVMVNKKKTNLPHNGLSRPG